MVALTDFTRTFEAAMTSTPRTASPAYTDLTAYVMAAESISLSRGRSSEQESQAQPGRGNVTLRNTDARFTMGNGSSPYAPLAIRRPCRYRVTYSATTYDRWTGFVDEWGNGRLATTGQARLSMSDRLARAGATKLKSALVAEMLYDSPLGLYAMQDAVGSVSMIDSSGHGDLFATTAPAGFSAFGSGAAPGPDGGTGCAFTPGITSVLFRLLSGVGGSGGLGRTVEAVVAIPTTSPGIGYGIAEDSTLGIYVDTDGIPAAATRTGATLTAKGTRDILDGATHVLAAVASSVAGTVTVSLYVDGVLSATTSGAGTTFSTSYVPTIGSMTDGSTGPFTGTMYGVGFYATALSGGRVVDHAAVLTSWSGETTLARFNRLCRTSGFPSAFYATTGTTEKTMGAQPTAGKSLLQALREVADVEGGNCYVSKAGVLTLATANTRYNTTVALTLDASKAGHVSTDTQVRTDDARLINDSTASTPTGTGQRTFNQTSIDSYDLADESVSLFTDLDTICLNWTQWRVANFKDPAPRCESVTVNVVAYATSGGNVAQLLNADQGTRLRLTNLPADVYPTSSLDLLIEGVKDDWPKDTYLITFTTSSIGQNDGLWVLGTSALGTGTKLGY